VRASGTCRGEEVRADAGGEKGPRPAERPGAGDSDSGRPGVRDSGVLRARCLVPACGGKRGAPVGRYLVTVRIRGRL